MPCTATLVYTTKQIRIKQFFANSTAELK